MIQKGDKREKGKEKKNFIRKGGALRKGKKTGYHSSRPGKRVGSLPSPCKKREFANRKKDEKKKGRQTVRRKAPPTELKAKGNSGFRIGQTKEGVVKKTAEKRGSGGDS